MLSTECILLLCDRYDFVDADGVHVKASGYRTLLFFLSCILQPLHQSLLKTAKDRSSFRFSASDHIKSLYIHCNAMQVSGQSFPVPVSH